MIVAVIAMHMMQAAIDEVVSVVAMGQRFVPARWTVLMARVMPLACAVTDSGVSRVHFQAVFVNMVFMIVMQMAIMNVVDVTLMANRRMSTAACMFMRMIRMGFVRFHCCVLSVQTIRTFTPAVSTAAF
jgi:hypothetical protein